MEWKRNETKANERKGEDTDYIGHSNVGQVEVLVFHYFTTNDIPARNQLVDTSYL